MRKIFILFILIGALNANESFNKGNFFAGGQIGFGGLGVFNLGANGGFQYYFPQDWQFGGFRNGIRAYASLDYGYANRFNAASHGIAIMANFDWLLEFNYEDSTIGGIFAGFGVGWWHLSNPNGFINGAVAFQAPRLGASLQFWQHHKIEAWLGYGVQIFGLGYKYIF